MLQQTTEECKKQVINYHKIIKSNSNTDIKISLNTYKVNTQSNVNPPPKSSINNINDQEFCNVCKGKSKHLKINFLKEKTCG